MSTRTFVAVLAGGLAVYCAFMCGALWLFSGKPCADAIYVMPDYGSSAYCSSNATAKVEYRDGKIITTCTCPKPEGGP